MAIAPDAYGEGYVPTPLPSSGVMPTLDYGALARVFLEPTPDMPAELVDALHLVHEVGRPRYLDDMLEGAKTAGLELGLGADATPEEVALRYLMLDRRGLEQLHNEEQVSRARAFQYFTTNVYPVPRLPEPTLEKMRVLEHRLDAFYRAWRRGGGTKVEAFAQQRLWHDSPEWLFLVRHGAPFRREEAMENETPTAVLFRPRVYAVLKYDTGRGEMGVHCSGPRECRALLRIFGSVLFGRSDFFPGRAKFDLTPLVKQGRACLACSDVPGIEEVRLTGVEFEFKEERRSVVQRADDIFSLVERGEIQWPRRICEIKKATFAVRLWRQKRPRRLVIMPCNRALYSRDEESPIMERWMEAREVIVPVRED